MKPIFFFFFALIMAFFMALLISTLFLLSESTEDFFRREELLSSGLVINVVGQTLIFLILSLVFSLQKKSYKKIFYLFGAITILMVGSDILISGFPNVRWHTTLKMVSIWMPSLIGILVMKKLEETYKKAIISAEK